MLRPQQYTSKVYNVNNTWVTFRNFILNLDTTFFFFYCKCICSTNWLPISLITDNWYQPKNNHIDQALVQSGPFTNKCSCSTIVNTKFVK